jgi:hypothetical protein
MKEMKEKKTARNMASNDEQTPLIQVVGVRPHRDRYGNHTVSLFAGLGPRSSARLDTSKDGSLKQHSFAAFAP